MDISIGDSSWISLVIAEVIGEGEMAAWGEFSALIQVV